MDKRNVVIIMLFIVTILMGIKVVKLNEKVVELQSKLSVLESEKIADKSDEKAQKTNKKVKKKPKKEIVSNVLILVPSDLKDPKQIKVYLGTLKEWVDKNKDIVDALPEEYSLTGYYDISKFDENKEEIYAKYFESLVKLDKVGKYDGVTSLPEKFYTTAEYDYLVSIQERVINGGGLTKWDFKRQIRDEDKE